MHATARVFILQKRVSCAFPMCFTRVRFELRFMSCQLAVAVATLAPRIPFYCCRFFSWQPCFIIIHSRSINYRHHTCFLCTVQTFAEPQGSCLNMWLGRAFKHLTRDPARVNAMKQTCVIVILAYLA